MRLISATTKLGRHGYTNSRLRDVVVTSCNQRTTQKSTPPSHSLLPKVQLCHEASTNESDKRALPKAPPQAIDIRFGKALRDARKAAGLTQAELAAKARIIRADVSLIERAERRPSLVVMERLANALDMTLDVKMNPIIRPTRNTKPPTKT